MKKIKIDLFPVFYQQVTFTLANNKYYLDLLWSSINNGWIYSIFDSKKSPIHTGRIIRIDVDLFENVNNTGSLIMEGDTPTRDNLGTLCKLYFYESDYDL